LYLESCSNSQNAVTSNVRQSTCSHDADEIRLLTITLNTNSHSSAAAALT